MAKNCLSKLPGNFLSSCTIPRVGVNNIYLMHAEDVTFTTTGGVISGVTFASGAKSILVEGYKQNIQVTSTLKTTDASARIDSTVSFKVDSNPTHRLRLNSVANGKFVVLVDYVGADFTLIGVTVPLECSSVEFDSNGGAKMYTVTLSSPEGSAGNNLTAVDAAVKNSIIAKSV